MKREIKFRAWNGKEMIYQESQKKLTDYNFQVFWNRVTGWSFWQKWDGKEKETWNEYENEPLMQYTGLKDKNGVNVYESDILENPQGKIGVIKFEDGGFILESKRDEVTIWTTKIDSGFLKNKTVIGNIHLTPELL